MSTDSRQHGGGIDWVALRSRMNQAEAAAEEALNPPPERAKAIMDARAKALSQAPASAPSTGTYVDVFEFVLGRERYAIETRFVREVIRFTDYTPVPGTPEFIVGVTNLRGAILPVVDLRQFFNVAQKGVTDLSRVIVLGAARIEFGILADETRGQIELMADDILPVRGEELGIGRAYLRGVTRAALIVLDGAALLADERLSNNRS